MGWNMPTITDVEARALKDGETLSERIGSRGEGALMLARRGDTVSGDYRYTAPDGSRQKIDLGRLGKHNPLRVMRAACRTWNDRRKSHPDLREWIEAENIRQRLELEAARQAEESARRAEAVAAATGTLEDLLRDYIENLKAKGRVSVGDVEQTFTRIIYGTPTGSMKARDIEPSHIRDILAQLYRAGAKTARNRLRAYLHAAFAFGLRSEYDESRESGRSFGLTINPVAATAPLDGVERVGTRYLNADELRAFYNELHRTPTTHRVMVAFLKFLIALGGQRPQQVLQVPWTDYDFENRTIRIIDRKGRAALPRVHLVPLTGRALELLEIAREVNPPDGDKPRTHPWTARGSEPISIQSLKNVIARFRKTEAGSDVTHFTPRDLRRTAKNVMTQAGVRRDLRNLLQNHGQTGVDVRHYANDPTAHLPEKRQAMIAFEAALARVLAGQALTGNVIEISTPALAAS